MGFADHGVAGDAATNARSDVASWMALGVELLEQLDIALNRPWIDVSQAVPRVIHPPAQEAPSLRSDALVLTLDWRTASLRSYGVTQPRHSHRVQGALRRT